MESLDERRETIALRFAKNCLKNENFSKSFSLNNHRDFSYFSNCLVEFGNNNSILIHKTKS